MACPKTLSTIAKVGLFEVSIVGGLQLLASCFEMTNGEALDSVWFISVLVSCFLVGSMWRVWGQWLQILGEEPRIVRLAQNVVVFTSAVSLFLLLLVQAGAVETLSFFDNYCLQLLFYSQLLMNIILHGRRLGHQKFFFCFLLDCMQMAANVFFFLLVEACALYVKVDKSFDLEGLSHEFWMCLSILMICNVVCGFISFCLHVCTNSRYMKNARPVLKDYSDIEFKTLLLLKAPVAFVSTMTIIAIVGRIWFAWTLLSALKAGIVVLYAISFVVVSVLLYFLQCFRLWVIQPREGRPVVGVGDGGGRERAEEEGVVEECDAEGRPLLGSPLHSSWPMK